MSMALDGAEVRLTREGDVIVPLDRFIAAEILAIKSMRHIAELELKLAQANETLFALMTDMGKKLSGPVRAGQILQMRFDA